MHMAIFLKLNSHGKFLLTWNLVNVVDVIDLYGHSNF